MNKQKTVICIDMDDTIVNLLESWVKVLNQKHGTFVQVEQITDWDITKFFPMLSPNQIFEPLYQEDFWRNVKPKKDAVSYIKHLIDDGYRIYICTNSNYKTLKVKLDEVLFKHFIYFSPNDIIVTSNKQLIDADILIDDGVHNLVGGSYKKILMDAPHNQNFDEQKHNIFRAKNWREIYILVKKLTSGDVSNG